MPGGKPDLVGVLNYPRITQLVRENGRKGVRTVIFLIVKNFCESLNVVRGMNEDQMIEAAGFLLDECHNYRIEDYVMMFSMVKRGQLVKILDRIDIQIIGQILTEYDRLRCEAGERQYIAQIKAAEGETFNSADGLTEEELKRQKKNWEDVSKMFVEMVSENRKRQDEERRRKIEESEKRMQERMQAWAEFQEREGIERPMIDLSEFKNEKDVKS